MMRPARLALLACALAACGGDDAEPRTAASADPPPPAEDVVPAALPADTPPGPEAPHDPTEFAALERLWSEQRYAEVLPLLKEHRRTAPYGKNEVVDYMIGTSACRVAGEEELGRRMFAWVLSHYSLNAESREMVLAEQRRCPPSARLVPVSLTLVGVGPASTSGTRGKLFYMLSRGEDVPMANEPVAVHRAIPMEELTARLFPPERAAEAVARVAELAGPGQRVVAEGPFVLASRTHGEEQLRGLGRALARYLDFYAETYGMPRPPHLVTVYLTSSGEELREVAERVHGIGISEQSIGYSFRDDLSMVGIIPGEVYGTLAHELFHLMVRRDFGDVPPWLDEGMAALYEVSRVEGDGRIRGLPNWRGLVLRELWGVRPSVAELVGADWQAFEAASDGGDPVRQAANHATARYLVLYLQEEGVLPEVYRAFRDRDATAARGDPAEDALRVLERAAGRSAATLDAEIAAWFGTLPH